MCLCEAESLPMTRVTKRETKKGWPPSLHGAQRPQPALSDSRLRSANNIEASERERDQRLRTALDWRRFETWSASNGFGPVDAPRETIGIVALYMTFLAATGRSMAIVARALLRLRDRDD